MCYDLNVECPLQAHVFEYLTSAHGAVSRECNFLDLGLARRCGSVGAGLEGYSCLSSDQRSLLLVSCGEVSRLPHRPTVQIPPPCLPCHDELYLHKQ